MLAGYGQNARISRRSILPSSSGIVVTNNAWQGRVVVLIFCATVIDQ
jgi:hypothetical protein